MTTKFLIGVVNQWFSHYGPWTKSKSLRMRWQEQTLGSTSDPLNETHLRPTPWTHPLPLESEKACARNKLVGLNTVLVIGKLRAGTLKSEFPVWNLNSILYKC